MEAGLGLAGSQGFHLRQIPLANSGLVKPTISPGEAGSRSWAQRVPGAVVTPGTPQPVPQERTHGRPHQSVPVLLAEGGSVMGLFWDP